MFLQFKHSCINLFSCSLTNSQYWVALVLSLHLLHVLLFISDRLSASLSNGLLINLQLSMKRSLYVFTLLWLSSSSSLSFSSFWNYTESVLYVSEFSPMHPIFDLNFFASSFIIKWKSELLPLWLITGIFLCSWYLELHNECAGPLHFPV